MEDYTMDKYIIDERTGLRYELVGDYYFIAGDDDPEERPAASPLRTGQRLPGFHR